MAHTHTSGDSAAAWGAGKLVGLVLGLLLAGLILFLVLSQPWAGRGDDSDVDVDINAPVPAQQAPGNNEGGR